MRTPLISSVLPVALLTCTQPETEMDSTPSSLSDEVMVANEALEACGQGGIRFNDIVAVTGNEAVRLEPSATAARLRNDRASQVLGRDHFHQVDGSTTVRRLCAQDGWSEIQIVTPDWLTHVRGWVPSQSLRHIERTQSGRRLYVEADFFWDEDTENYSQAIVQAANQIAAENRNCETIQTSSVARSPTRSRPGDPVFFLTCGAGSQAFNVWFRPAEVGEKGAFDAIEPIGRLAAVSACQQEAIAVANFPDSVRFPLGGAGFVQHASGRARVIVEFSARNAFDSEQRFQMNCLFEGDRLIESQVAARP